MNISNQLVKEITNPLKKLINMVESVVASTVVGMSGQYPVAENVGQETFIRLYQ